MARARLGVWMVWALAACAGTGVPAAMGQGTVQPGAIVQDADASAGSGDVPPWIAVMAADPESPAMRALAAQNKERKELEKQVRQIRHRFLKSGKDEVVQEGFVMLRDVIAPQNAYKVAAFPMLLEVFERDDMTIRLQVLDLIRDSKTDEGDTTLAWAAVMSKDKEMRDAARGRLLERVAARDAEEGRTVKVSAGGAVAVAQGRRAYPVGVARVVHEGLRTRREHTMAAAANLASVLGMFEAIPGLIAGQLSGAGFGGGAAGTERSGDLAWIMVGQQQAFVADLTPVVGEGAVGFDPELGVVTEGVILRIKDAAIYAYSFDVHNALVAMADAATGVTGDRSTAAMGFDSQKWMAWWEANKQTIVGIGH